MGMPRGSLKGEWMIPMGVYSMVVGVLMVCFFVRGKPGTKVQTIADTGASQVIGLEEPDLHLLILSTMKQVSHQDPAPHFQAGHQKQGSEQDGC